MRTVASWTDRIPEQDGNKTPVNSLSYRTDGTQLIVAVGLRVLVYDAVVGDLVHSLKGHKETVYCVSYSKDGKRFASGGADKTVIIWTTKAEGILKYQHSESIQCLAYNPVTQQLASATSTDFGLWHPEQKSVSKHKVSSKVLCCAWTNDGNNLALGQFNGHISIRDKSGEEKLSIKRQAPVWTIAWNPSREECFDILAVGCWDQTLSFHHLSGKPIGKDRQLGFDPCCISYFLTGDYICVAGSDRKVTLWTKEGVKLTTVAEVEDWVWCVEQRPKQNFVAVGTNDGQITTYQLIFSTVHGLYQDQYAFREQMTDVVVQQLVSEKRLLIKCKDYVKKIAIYRDRLAVQLPDKIMIYELFYDDNYEMKFRTKDKINEKLDCNLLVVTSNHIVLCQEKKLQLFDLTGTRHREWVLDAVIRYIKVVGGPPEREELLVGLKNGAVLKIFIDNPFPIKIIELSSPVRQVDLSASKMKLAVVDENANCLVYHLKNQSMLFQESNANSIAWNTEYEDMLCFSGNGVLNIKTGTFPVHQQKMQGFVVGFKGSKIFCLHFVAMQTIDVPQSASMYKYLEKRDFSHAYQIACLGVTDNDWRALALQALSGLNLEIARKAFIRIRDVRYLELLNRIETERRLNPQATDDSLNLANIYAYQGKYEEAAEYFKKANQSQKAVEMYADLKMWPEARAICSADDEDTLRDLIKRQATWSEETADWKEASSLWVQAGEFNRAINIMGERGWMDELNEVCRKLSKNEVQAIRSCGQYFRANSNHQYAKEAYLKINDVKSLMQLHVESHKWEEAFAVLDLHPEFAEDVYLPYAEWLAVNDRFDEAQEAFKKANQPRLAVRMIEQLAHNAVTERRFRAAGYYFWKLAQENLRMHGDDEEEGSPLSPQQKDHCLSLFHVYYDRSELYFMYSHVQKYIESPFTSEDTHHLFHCARSLLMRINQGAVPLGINKLTTVLALAKLGRQMECYKLSRMAYDKLNTFVLPINLIDELDLASLIIRTMPYQDKDDELHVCFRCGATNTLLNNNGDCCTNCKAPFIRSFVTFEHLPLVEFRVADAPDEEVIALIDSPFGLKSGVGRTDEDDGWNDEKVEGADVLNFDNVDTNNVDSDDPFQRMVVMQGTSENFQPLEINIEHLKRLKKEEVFMVNFGHNSRPRLYRKMNQIDQLVNCPECGHFFDEGDWEFESLKAGGCPVCSVSS